MSRASRVGLLAGAFVALGAVGAEEAAAQDRLYTVTRQGRYDVVAGDYLQVRYVTQAVADGIADLKVEVSGDSVQKLPVFTASIRGQPQLPGGRHYVIAMLRAEEVMAGRGRESSVVVTPVTNDGQELNAFRFSVNVR